MKAIIKDNLSIEIIGYCNYCPYRIYSKTQKAEICTELKKGINIIGTRNDCTLLDYNKAVEMIRVYKEQL